MRKTRKRSKSILSDRILTVLNCLSMDQLKTVRSKIGIDSAGKSKEELSDAILTSGKPLGTILKAAYTTEINSPYKHLFMVKINSCPLDLNMNNQSFRPLINKNIGAISAIHTQHETNISKFLFEHEIISKELRSVEDQEGYFKIYSTVLRHVIVVELDTIRKVLSISYPGFAQGRGTKTQDRITYEDVVNEVLELFKDKFGVTTLPILFKKALNELSSSKESRVILSRTSPKTSRGEMDFKGYLSGNFSAVDVLKNFLLPHLPNVTEQVLTFALEEAIRSSFSQSEIALWVHEKVTTRISYWDNGAELLFIWYDNSPSNHLINEVKKLLLSIENIISSPNTEQIWNYISSVSKDSIVTTNELTTTCGQSPELVRETVKQAILAGLLKPVFRLKTAELLEEIKNDWITDLKPIWKKFKDVKGTEVDGSDPSNIEIAFKRTESVKQEEVSNA